MADRINLNRLRNINFAPNKNVAKTTAAMTLLLSTVACNSKEIGRFFDSNACWIIPLSCYGGAIIVGGILGLLNRRGGGGGSSDGGHGVY